MGFDNFNTKGTKKAQRTLRIFVNFVESSCSLCSIFYIPLRGPSANNHVNINIIRLAAQVGQVVHFYSDLQKEQVVV